MSSPSTAALFNEPSTDFHLKLNEQLFHIPYSLLQKNYDQFQNKLTTYSNRIRDMGTKIDELLSFKELESDKLALKELNNCIKTTEHLEKSIKLMVNNELEILNRIEQRIKFFQDLQMYKDSRDKLGLVQWYQSYTNLMIGDYLTRNGELDESTLENPGVIYLKQQNLDGLLDYKILLNANRISQSLLKNHDLTYLIKCVKENETYLRDKKSNLEFMTRFQQYIELLKEHDYENAIKCYQNHLIRFLNTNFNDLQIASGLMIYMETCQNLLVTMQKENKLNNYESTPFMERLSTYERDPSLAFNHFFKNKNCFSLASHYPISNNNNNKFPTRMSYSLNNQKVNFFNRENLVQYLDLLGDENWVKLNELFLDEYYSMYGISRNEPLLIYLSLGASALKTKACFHDKNTSIIEQYNNILHSRSGGINIDEIENKGYVSDAGAGNEHKLTMSYENTTDDEKNYNSCPICNGPFKNIAESLPYAHHTESKLFENPVMLPNGNVYDAERIKLLARQLRARNMMHLQDGEIFDPIDKQIYMETDFIKMYPT